MHSVAHSPLVLMNPLSEVKFTLKTQPGKTFSGEYIGHDFVHYPTNENEHPEYFSYKEVDSFTYEETYSGFDPYKNNLEALQMLLHFLPSRTEVEIACIYHAGCPDGLMSAAVVKHKFPNHNIQFIEGRHGQEIDIDSLAGKVVFITDFSFAPETLYKISKVAFKFIMLDHHQSAMEKVQDSFRESWFSEMIIKDSIIFADQKSGCGLTWEILFPNFPVPQPIKYIQDGDIWTWKEPYAKQILPAIYFQTERTVDGFYKLLTEPFYANQYMSTGLILEKQKEKHVQEIVKASLQTAEIYGYKVGIVNCNSVYASDVGHYVIEQTNAGYEYAIVYRFTPDGVKLSLRSDDHLANVSLIATEHFNGGGHRNASGGILTPQEFYNKILSKVIPNE